MVGNLDVLASELAVLALETKKTNFTLLEIKVLTRYGHLACPLFLVPGITSPFRGFYLELNMFFREFFSLSQG